MRFPNIVQTILLIFFLLIIHWFLNRFITLPEQDNLKTLLVSITKLVLLLVGISILSKQKNIDKPNIKIKRPTVYLCLISVFIGILIVFNPLLGSISFFKEDDILKIVDSVIGGSIDVFVFLNLVILVPIFEELFFRGIIFSGLKNNYNTVLALILSSVLFGIFHVDVVGSTAFGLWLGWMFLKSNNILLCIITHSACNLISFFFRIIAKDDQGQQFFTYIGENAMVISIVMLLIAAFLFQHSSKRLNTQVVH